MDAQSAWRAGAALVRCSAIFCANAQPRPSQTHVEESLPTGVQFWPCIGRISGRSWKLTLLDCFHGSSNPTSTYTPPFPGKTSPSVFKPEWMEWCWKDLLPPGS
eukprot:3781287-Rhodomonas_salina.1